MGFREFLNEETKIKVKKELILDVDAKKFSGDVPLCRKISAEVKKLCDLIEHNGYYVLQNRKSYKTDLIVSPENLSKIPGAAEALKDNTSFKIGVSEYTIYEGRTICNKTSELIVTGEVISEIKKNTNNTKYMDAQLIYGLNLSALTENVASSSVVNGKYCGYFNKDKTAVKIHGVKGTIDTSKPFITWAQQHASRPFSLWEANTIEWAEVSMNVMFPKAYSKSTIYKKDVFVIK